MEPDRAPHERSALSLFHPATKTNTVWVWVTGPWLWRALGREEARVAMQPVPHRQGEWNKYIFFILLTYFKPFTQPNTCIIRVYNLKTQSYSEQYMRGCHYPANDYRNNTPEFPGFHLLCLRKFWRVQHNARTASLPGPELLVKKSKESTNFLDFFMRKRPIASASSSRTLIQSEENYLTK